MGFLSTPEFWVAVSFFLFLGLLAYLGVPKLLTKSLDERASGIEKELAEAKRLREEAQELVATYQRKQEEAMREAEQIVTQAHEEAERIAKETRAAMQEQVARRTQLAEDKIAQAEQQAVADVRAAAVDVATRASERLIADRLQGDEGQAYMGRAVNEVATKLQ